MIKGIKYKLNYIPNQKLQLSNLGTFFPFFIQIKKGSLYSQSLWDWVREKSTLEQVETELSTTHKNPRNLWRSKKKYKLNHKKNQKSKIFYFHEEKSLILSLDWITLSSTPPKRGSESQSQFGKYRTFDPRPKSPYKSNFWHLKCKSCIV